MVNSGNKTSKLRLKWKIFMFLLGFCALLLAILWLFQTVLLDTFYRNIRASEIKSIGRAIAKNADQDDLEEIIAEYAETSDINITVERSGKRLNPEHSRLIELAQTNEGEFYEYIQSAPEQPNTANSAAPPQPNTANSAAPPQPNAANSAAPPQPNAANTVAPPQPRLRQLPISRVPMRSLVYVKQAGDTFIIIRAVISPVNATVNTLRVQLYLVSSIMLILSAIIAIAIAKKVSKPIEDISQSAKVLAKGNYDVRFAGKGFYEIVALSDTLNTAAVELSRAEGFRRELMANVSHDLRTPLALIYSYAEMMHDFPDEMNADSVQIIMNESKRLYVLVNDVLDISKIESDMDRLNKTLFNLTRNVQDTVERMNAFLKPDEFNITFHYDGEIWINADEAKISRVFYNMLINAVNYSGLNRLITVTQTGGEKNVRISVTDGGEGISQEELPYVWERYYKSSKNHVRAVTGSGLGLSIVKKIIELHGGMCGVKSEPGAGSTFWFEISL